ncbi:fibroleukin-like [Mya arenaria]|uniref:fibroleukin-like n=1 Tax=Mya arenaria TaxID=6604 RepID=UPI0022E44D11|nr:fibroleukin-like [Mya arenaria]
MCSSGQSCFMETTDTVHGVLYHTGCLSNNMCTPPGYEHGIVGRSTEKRQRTSCHECCFGNLCNDHLCTSSKYDCSDVLRSGLSRGSGVYRITPWNMHKEVEVYCDMDTEGGGWTVFQRRLDGSVNFNRNFSDYEQGFGSLDGEFWLGLSLLHSMTSRANMTLRLDMSFSNGTTGFDEYSGFYISPPEGYNVNVDKRINSAGSTFFFV